MSSATPSVVVRKSWILLKNSCYGRLAHFERSLANNALAISMGYQTEGD